MRSVRDWIAQASAAAVAAALAVVVIGAGLSGFAIAELTADDGDSATTAPAGPAVVGGSGQTGASTLPAVIASVQDRAEALRLARRARSNGASVKIVRFGGSWLVVTQSSQ
jgi:hypothetical protein